MFHRDGLFKKVTVAYADLTDYQSIERVVNEYEPEAVIHLGAQAIVGIANASPLGTFETNIRGTWNMLEACRLHDKAVKSIVVASSDKAYGSEPVPPYPEDLQLKGQNPYDVSKSCADLLSQSYGRTYGLPIAITRCGNFYGGGDLNFSRIVPSTILSAFNGEPPVIRSDGSFMRDYIYVKDAVSAYTLLTEKTEEKGFKGEAFNFSTDDRLSVLQMVQKILSLMGKEDLKPVIKNQVTNEIKEQHIDSAKARDILGWKSQWPFESSMKETIAWYRDYLSRL
jgi:CDP-glucose 4,6-dehydratase